MQRVRGESHRGSGLVSTSGHMSENMLIRPYKQLQTRGACAVPVRPARLTREPGRPPRDGLEQERIWDGGHVKPSYCKREAGGGEGLLDVLIEFPCPRHLYDCEDECSIVIRGTMWSVGYGSILNDWKRSRTRT